MVRERLIEWLLTLIQRSAAHGALLRGRLVEFERLLTERADVAQTAAVRKLAALRRQAQALTDAVAEGGELTSLIQRLRDVESEIKSLQVVERSSRRPNAKSEPRSQLNLPELIGSLLARSYPFADWLRRLIPEFIVHPAQAWDTPQIRPIGILRVDTSRMEGPENTSTNNSESLEEFEMPLFEEPKSIDLLIPCAAVRRQHPDWSLRRIADELGVNTMSVKRAFDYERLMAQAGTTKPYRILREAPVAASRWRGPSKKS